MTTGAPYDDRILRLERRFAATRQEVFAAWTDPNALVRWFSPGPVELLRAELALEPDGSYRFDMRSLVSGEEMTVSGAIRELVPPERLVLTWRPGVGSASGELCETLVTVCFEDRGLECDLVLTQELFPSRSARDEHRLGWEYCLEQLAAFLEGSAA